MNLKIIQYNIRTGFRHLESPFKYEKNRKKIAIKIIKRENPDILILNEAYFESKNSSGIIMDYQKIFKFNYYKHIHNKKGLIQFRGDAVLSKFPIISAKNKSKGMNDLLRLKIKINSSVINLDVLHLPPTPFSKDIERKNFLKSFVKNQAKNHIITGDFNSLSKYDNYNKNNLIKSWLKIEKDAKNVISDMLKGQTTKYLISKEYVDSYKAKNKKFDFTIPTDFLSKDKSTGIRIDYIFCSKDLKIINSGIIKDRLAELASDHYPIYTIFEI